MLWEYKVETLDDWDQETVTAMLTDMGQKGWELVSVSYSMHTYFFKRPEEWEVTNMRTVKWNKEQTRHLRKRLSDMESPKLVFHHDTDGLDYISAFAAAIKPFGLYVVDVTKEDGETLEVIITDEKPEKEWNV